MRLTGHVSLVASGPLKDPLDRHRVLTGGRVSPRNLRDCRVPEYAASPAKPATVTVGALFPVHHEISPARAGRHLETANAAMARDLLPESTV